jgi:hypothetical protein
MAFDKKAWMRVYMRAYRRGKRRRPRPGYFDKKVWSRPYMREYMTANRIKKGTHLNEYPFKSESCTDFSFGISGGPVQT